MTVPSSRLKCFAFRLKPGQDLKKEIMLFAKENKIKAGCMISCVGSVTQIQIRPANKEQGLLKKGYFEIVSLVGTFSSAAAHLHVSVADGKGNMMGGHLLEGTLVFTTAELVVGSFPQLEFARSEDPLTGYRELIVRGKKIQKTKP